MAQLPSVVPIIQDMAQFQMRQTQQIADLAQKGYELRRRKKAEQIGTYHGKRILEAQSVEELTKAIGVAYQDYIQNGLQEFAGQIIQMGQIREAGLNDAEKTKLYKASMDATVAGLHGKFMTYKGKVTPIQEAYKQLSLDVPGIKERYEAFNNLVKAGEVKDDFSLAITPSGGISGGMYKTNAQSGSIDEIPFTVSGGKVYVGGELAPLRVQSKYNEELTQFTQRQESMNLYYKPQLMPVQVGDKSVLAKVVTSKSGDIKMYDFITGEELTGKVTGTGTPVTHQELGMYEEKYKKAGELLTALAKNYVGDGNDSEISVQKGESPEEIIAKLEKNTKIMKKADSDLTDEEKQLRNAVLSYKVDRALYDDYQSVYLNNADPKSPGNQSPKLTVADIKAGATVTLPNGIQAIVQSVDPVTRRVKIQGTLLEYSIEELKK